MIAGKSFRKNMQTVVCAAVIVSTVCWFSGVVQAEEAARTEKHHIDKVVKTPHLSPDLQEILLLEMNKIEQGMQAIIPALSAGNWETISRIATKIKKSFILKQKLTKKQLKKLHKSLPSEFIEMDHSFHAAAGKLADAAEQHDGELVNFYYYRLHSKCINCHSRFAADRFVGLKNLTPPQGGISTL